MRRQTSKSGINPAGSSCVLRLDPLSLPQSFDAQDLRADGGVRNVEIHRERVVLRRAVKGMRMSVNVRVSDFLGIALRGLDDEAQMVYQFSLPPLTLHTFRTGDATVLSRWAATISRMSERTTFFHFTASHDGIGVRPAQGLLSDAEIGALVEMTLEHGGLVSYRNNPDGTQSPYELNITYFDAITEPAITAKQLETAVNRFICSQAIMLAMIGVPGWI